MLARDLAEAYPVIGLDDNAADAVRLLARDRLAGLIVIGEAGRPVAILPPSQVLRFVLPDYIQEDPPLARVIDESTARAVLGELRDRSVRDLLPERLAAPPIGKADDTVLEVAALMAQQRCPLVAIMDGVRLLGAITVWHLLELGLDQP